MTSQPLLSKASISRNQIRESYGLCTTVMTSTLRFGPAGSRRLQTGGAVRIVMRGCLEPFDSGTAAHDTTCVQESARTHGKLVQVIVPVVLEQDTGIGVSHRTV